jgi:flagella basal body P-ring formation protein FlgA
MMFLALLAAACLPVSGPNITAKELATAVHGFAPADPAVVFGYSPMPGVQRIVHPAEVQQFLIRQQFTGAGPTSDICFERPTAQLNADAVSQSMRAAIGPDAHIEIVELSRFPAPAGELVFPREDIGAPPLALWRGYVRYDGDKKFPVWARVKLSVRTVRIVALEELRPGVPIKASQLAVQTIEDFPSRRTSPGGIAQVEGALPRRFISANSPVWNDSIDPPNEITKGDRVSVIVHSGLAQLSFDAEAQTSGRRGDVVSFKNPESGRLFRARVEGPNRAAVDTLSIRQ